MNEKSFSSAVDKLEITEVLTRYCRGLDRLDAELVRSVFHDDAMDHHGPFDKLGKELAPELVKMAGDSTDVAMHLVTNVSIELSADKAWAESYMVAHTSHGSNYQDVGARFVDRFERRQDVWKIAERWMIMEFMRTAPMGEASPFLAMFNRGSRDKHDPSYKR